MKTASFKNIPAAVRSFWENLNGSDIADTFGRKTIQRGKDYAQQGLVKKLWMSNDSRYLLAAVQGSEKYYTHVKLKTDKQKKQLTLFSHCTCPVGPCCKHAVAAVAVFLDRLANSQPVLLCKRIDKTTWKVSDKSGTIKSITIDFDAEQYDDNDDANDDCRASKQNTGDFIKQTFKDKSAEELISIILSLVEEYDNVRNHFEQLQVLSAAGKKGVPDKILKQVLALMDKEENSRWQKCRNPHLP